MNVIWNHSFQKLWNCKLIYFCTGLNSKVIVYFILVQIGCESSSNTCIHFQDILVLCDVHIFHIYNPFPLGSLTSFSMWMFWWYCKECIEWWDYIWRKNIKIKLLFFDPIPLRPLIIFIHTTNNARTRYMNLKKTVVELCSKLQWWK